MKTGSPAQDHRVAWVHLHSVWTSRGPRTRRAVARTRENLLNKYTASSAPSKFLCSGARPHPHALALRSQASWDGPQEISLDFQKLRKGS